MSSATSIKEKLKNNAKKEHSSVQNEFILYGLERTIYRISISRYADRFILKGGIFLYAVFERDFARATQDIDILAWRINNEADNIERIFKEIFSIECDDALCFDLSSIKVKNITEFKEYHGVNISVTATLDKTRIPVSIDIGFGDVIYPERIKMDFPTILDMEVPVVYAYSIYSVISEKFEAIVSLGLVNSRLKDFYDIYFIGKSKCFCGRKLQNAIIETFNHRNTGFDDIVAFTDEYINDKNNQSRWNHFVNKRNVTDKVDFPEAIEFCKAFLLPVVESIVHRSSFEKNWDPVLERWM